MEVYGTSGTFFESLNIMLRCILLFFGVEVHS